MDHPKAWLTTHGMSHGATHGLSREMMWSPWDDLKDDR